MNRIDTIFAALRARNRRGLMPFICGGHPAPGATPGLLEALQRAGADIAEVGIPFSDPIADGPVIAAAMHEALKAGSTPRTVLQEIASVRPRLTMGLVAMVSVSIVHRLGGPSGFCRDARTAGFDGVIFPDVPLEEAGELVSAAKAVGLACSLLVAPTSPPDRAAAIARACTGFVYLLARAGITGERQDIPDISGLVRTIRAATSLPIACGFGISSPRHVSEITRHADAAIVGSALVRRVTDAARAGREFCGEAEAFVRELAGGLGADGSAA